MRFLELDGPCKQIKCKKVNKIIMKAVDISYKSILSHFEVSLYKTTHFQVIYSKMPSRVQYPFHSLIITYFIPLD